MVHIGYHKKLRNKYSMHTYIPMLGSFIVLQKKTPEFTMCMWLTKLILIMKSSIQCNNTCSHLLPATSVFFYFLHLAEVLQYHIIQAYILDFNYTHVS